MERTGDRDSETRSATRGIPPAADPGNDLDAWRPGKVTQGRLKRIDSQLTRACETLQRAVEAHDGERVDRTRAMLDELLDERSAIIAQAELRHQLDRGLDASLTW